MGEATCPIMETKLCRLCGRLGENFLHIFKTAGLKEKIETCLPIIVSPFCLLPDTICKECTENVCGFYDFMKYCLEKIIILETQYNIQDSCLKSRQKRDKSCQVAISTCRANKSLQTDDILDILSGENYDLMKYGSNFPLTVKFLENRNTNFEKKTEGCLVDYEVDSDSCTDEADGNGKVELGDKLRIMKNINNYVESVTSERSIVPKLHYFDDKEKILIGEITQRKSLKRQSDYIERKGAKIFKIDCNNRRKNKMPKKLETIVTETSDSTVIEKKIEEEKPKGNTNDVVVMEVENSNVVEKQPINHQVEKMVPSLPWSCLLCESQFSGTAALATHVFETHGIDMAEITPATENVPEKSKKKIPNLLKISDLKKNESVDDNPPSLEVNEQNLPEEQQQESSVPHSGLVCPICLEPFDTKTDLMVHLGLKHPKQSAYFCGLCLQQCISSTDLKNHLQVCSQQHRNVTRYVCQVCYFGEDNFKLLENHVLVHEFLLAECKKQSVMFDPANYIDANETLENGSSPVPTKNLSCDECGLGDFESFKEYSSHRRSRHSIFHCDLCSKFYGRNSHLWKHVNRLHKGHPSITCQLCYKTSASKYHLAQHFGKIHQTKNSKKGSDTQTDSKEEFLNRKFRAFDFQSVRQKFARQELMEQEQRSSVSDDVGENSNNLSEFDGDTSPEHQIKEETSEAKEEPKEIDSSHNMYTNIITNYTPPLNEGEFKCPKCSKAFHKKMLLKKHKKNCRPKLQKDLLTRCKTCARVFKDRQSLAKHLVNYHSEYVCEICSQKVQSKCEIVSHIRFQHPGCHLVCNLCTNILRSQDDLQEHIRNHSESYICQFCGDPLPSKIKLKMHILSLHRKILSLSCGICLKLFENQHVLRNHVTLVHKDQLTPLTSCPVCGKNYGSKWKTYDHLNKSHGRIFRACKTCLEVFNNDAQLQAHCDVTGHGGHGSSVSAANLRNSIMAHITSAIKDVVENDANEDVSDSGDENEDTDRSDEEYDNEPVEEEEDQKLYLTSKQLSHIHSSKISLLERRLLGKKLAEPEIVHKTKSPNSNKKKSPATPDPHKDKAPTKEDVDSNNPLINSSKRTVYVNSNDPSYCEICFKTWPAKKHLWQHYIRCHKSVAATVCGICLKCNDNYETLQKHLVENHPTLLHGQGFGSNFICRICGRYHNASSKLRLHMVIHENFDWSMIENIPNNNSVNNKEKSLNGFGQLKRDEGNGTYAENDINYDSLIEQVECSSQSENGDGESDEQMRAEQKGQVSSGSEDDEDSDDSAMSDNSMEDLNGMLAENKTKQKRPSNAISSSDEDSNSSFTDNSKSGSSDEDEGGSESMSSQGKFANGNSNTVDSIMNGNIFRRKPEELDSAIQSISYECIKQEDLKVDEDFCELQSNCLNENEIESAVGSIL